MRGFFLQYSSRVLVLRAEGCLNGEQGDTRQPDLAHHHRAVIVCPPLGPALILRQPPLTYTRCVLFSSSEARRSPPKSNHAVPQYEYVHPLYSHAHAHEQRLRQ